MLVPYTIYLQVRTLAVVLCSSERAENHVVCRILVRHIQFRGHHHLSALLGKEFRTTQDAMEIFRVAFNGVIHHHLSTVRESHQHLSGEVNRMSASIFRFQSLVFKSRQRYKLY